MAVPDAAYNAMVDATDRLIAVARITDEELATAHVLVVNKPYSDPATERGSGSVRAGKALMIGLSRVGTADPSWAWLYEATSAYERDCEIVERIGNKSIYDEIYDEVAEEEARWPDDE
jgi:hypothetical protein